MERIRKRAIHAPSAGENIRLLRLPDPDDAPFLACAAELGVPLVTDKLKHFPRTAVGKVEVLAPASHVRRLREMFLT